MRDKILSPDTKLGLALAGGGARGIAHIGVIEGLVEIGVEPTHIAGTSAGAIIAAMYAYSLDPKWVHDQFRAFLDSPEFRALGTQKLARRYEQDADQTPFSRRVQDHVVIHLSLYKQHMIDRSKLRAAMEFLVPASDFKQLQIPLIISAADLQSGLPIRYREGDLHNALCNSASIPGVLEPELNGSTVISDGGVLEPVPVEPLREHCRFVIASEISRHGLPPMDEININSLMIRAEQLTQMTLAKLQAQQANYVLSPDVMALHWSQFGAFDDLYANGLACVRDHSDQLIKTIRKASGWRGRLAWKLRQLGKGQQPIYPAGVE